MHVKPKIVVICAGAPKVGSCHRALAIAGSAWDAGAAVRVRRIERCVPQARGRPLSERADSLRDAADMPEVSVADIAWADAVFFETSRRDGVIPAPLERLIHAGFRDQGSVIVPVTDDAEAARPADEGRRIVGLVRALAARCSALARVA